MWQNLTPIYQGLYKKVMQNARYKMKTISILSSLQTAFISECDKASKSLVGFLFSPSQMWQQYEHPSWVSESAGHFSPLLITQSRKSLTSILILLWKYFYIVLVLFSSFSFREQQFRGSSLSFYFIILWSVRHFILHGCNVSGIEVMLLVLVDSGFSF